MSLSTKFMVLRQVKNADHQCKEQSQKQHTLQVHGKLQPVKKYRHYSHRHLQSCVGTQARLGYAAFNAQLRKAYFVTTLYAIHMSVHAYAICW